MVARFVPVVRAESPNGRCVMIKEWRPCTCKKSRCLKLYCECFAASTYCDPAQCRCVGCHNLPGFDAERKKAIVHILARKPDAFRSKIQETSTGHVKHLQGCKCSRSRCLKKYCECFQAGILCQSHCRCKRCENFSGSKALEQIRGTQQKAPAAASPHPRRRQRGGGSGRHTQAPGNRGNRARRDSTHLSGSDTPSEGDQRDVVAPAAKRARLAPPQRLGRSQSQATRGRPARGGQVASNPAQAPVPAGRIPEHDRPCQDDIVEAAGRMLKALSQPSVPRTSIGAPHDPILGSEPWRGSDSCPAVLPANDRLSPVGHRQRPLSPPQGPSSSASLRAEPSEHQQPVPVGSTTPSKSRRSHNDILSPRTERAYIAEVVRALQTMSEQVGGGGKGGEEKAAAAAPPVAPQGYGGLRVGEVTPLVPSAAVADTNDAAEEVVPSSQTAFRKGVVHTQGQLFRGPPFLPISQSTEQVDLEGDHSRVSVNSVHEDSTEARRKPSGAE